MIKVENKHYCQINTQGFALATAGVMAIIYLLCTLVVALWPNLALQLFGSLIHLVNLEKAVDIRLTSAGFISGLLQAVIYTYIGAWLVAWLHNKFCQAK
ncbi:MAG: hypothetical protein A2729_03790 [Candidatus Buchananbacteria bacterium RIFCSPHIGHO2_01_FULL_39_14]|uniref:Uncharacterized protein n=2 Tax=Candidatus Buchananiibacteriota TaxID=1817903 RepID=A0A1G1YPM0_9BACT|nr:MAG: hypothetical protein A2729_03790 [Candidatus Buchananbacteria bacterium RIFCSPHIGHO2_01_FULL_39_14]OGY48499.1 MAG: hypothetical protein A3D39_04970 [Candidatus Buchananbacteria bacterium RIFCSPHIGHO2_02_FULL_39_17]OGY54254.1 MAG: hypothetical protein A2912_04400 [Candidatus Buchananbacteria bacterium RIFCSPLOWO2_01_FULL_40_23b]